MWENRTRELASAIPAPSRVLDAGSCGFPSAGEELAFFASLHQSNGTTRMTSSNRLSDVNAAIASCLPRGTALEALDVGISSGVSTVEWLDSLEQLGHKCSMTALDRVLRARLYRFGNVELLAEMSAHTLLIHTGRRVFMRPTRSIAQWRNRFVRSAFQLADFFARLFLRVGAGREVRLVSHRLLSRPEILLVEHDLFSPAADWVGRFHVVRVANVLNRGYFAEPVLRAGLRNTGDWVRPGGLLAVARTESDGRNHASIFRRENNRFTIINRIGAGSEVEALVTQ